MNTINVTKQFDTEEKCLDYLEKMRWPAGVACLKCGSQNVAKITRASRTKNKRKRLFQCREKECGHQFSATAGTIFHDSHLPLEKWFMAIALICEAKKGLSACQMQRHLGVSYRTAWYLCHRIREAMKDDSMVSGTVELDETYIGGRTVRVADRHKPRRPKDVVVGVIQRGGKLHLTPIPWASSRHVKTVVDRRISKDVDTIMTDDGSIYPFAVDMRFSAKRKMIRHNRRIYAIGNVHTNSIENAFSLLKRGILGVYHKVSIKHLGRYCDEFSYRFNRREEQEWIFEETAKGLTRERTLPYKKLTTSQSSPISGF
jgi:ISXO2-like transposase domain/Transposase zinc-ribbon domain